MGLFKTFLNSIKVADFNNIKTIKSETIKHYGIEEFGLRIKEKQVIEFQKYKFIYVNDPQHLRYQMNNFQLLYKPKYVFEYYGNYYIVVKSKDWKKLTKYLLTVYNKPQIIVHLIISVACGLNEILKNNLDYNFNNFDINNFYINIEKKEKGFYKFYEPKINKDLLFKSKYNIKYIGVEKEQLYRKADLNYETLPFYNFLYSFQQFLKLYNNEYLKVEEYFRILTKNDNFLSFYDTDMQNYIISHYYYSTFEEILHLDFIIKTIGTNYLKTLKKMRKQKGGDKQFNDSINSQNNENDELKNIDLLYEDVNNMEHFENIVNYQENQNQKENEEFVLNRLNNSLNQIIKLHDFENTNNQNNNDLNDFNYTISGTNIQLDDIINKHENLKNSKTFKNSRFANISEITFKIPEDKNLNSFINSDFSQKQNQNILFDSLGKNAKYQQFDNFDFYNNYTNNILQDHLTDKYNDYKLRQYLSKEPFDSSDSENLFNSTSTDSLSLNSDNYLKENRNNVNQKKIKKFYVIDENDYIDFLNNQIDNTLKYHKYLNQLLPINKLNTSLPQHDESLNDYLSFLNNQINNELIKHETIKKHKENNYTNDYTEMYKKTLDTYLKNSDKTTETETKEDFNTDDYEKLINAENEKVETKSKKKQKNKQSTQTTPQANGGKTKNQKSKNTKKDSENNEVDYYHQEYEKEFKKPESSKESEDYLHIEPKYENLTNELNDSVTDSDIKDYEAYRLNNNSNSPVGIETDINNNIDNYLNSRHNLKTSEGGDGENHNQHWNKPNYSNNQNNQNNQYKPYNNQNNNWQKNNNQPKSYNNQQNYNNQERKNSNDAAKQENIKIANADVVPELNPPINKKEDREVNDFVAEYKKQLETDNLKHLKTDAETSYYVVKKNALGLYGNTLTNLNPNYNMYYILDILPDKFNMSRFVFGNTYERKELIEYLKDFLINKSNGRDIDANSISSLFSMMKIINTYPEDYKGNEKSLKYQPKYNSITPDYVSFRSCYPLTIEKGQTKCAANSTMINVKLYNLKYYEDVTKNLYEDGLIYYDKKLDKKDIELIEKLDKEDPLIQNRISILHNKEYLNKSVSFNELKFYDYVKKKLIDPMVCPHFPCLIGNKIVSNDIVNPDFITSDTMYRRFKNNQKDQNLKEIENFTNSIKNIKINDQNQETIGNLMDKLDNENNKDRLNKLLFGFISFYPKEKKKEYERLLKLNPQPQPNSNDGKKLKILQDDIKFQLLKILHKDDINKVPKEKIKELIYNPEAYTNKSLVILTENPGYSFDSWIKPEYETIGNVRKMIDSGYKSLAEWKSIIFQILYTFQCMVKHNILIPNFSIDNLFIQHSKLDPSNSYYSVYNINGIEYYVPYYGDTIVFDILHRDNVFNDLQVGNKQ